MRDLGHTHVLTAQRYQVQDGRTITTLDIGTQELKVVRRELK